MARERRPQESWPAWHHAPDGSSRIFQCKEDVPDGWTRKKQDGYSAPPPPVIDKEATIALLITNGVKIDPRWGLAQLKKELDKYG